MKFGQMTSVWPKHYSSNDMLVVRWCHFGQMTLISSIICVVKFYFIFIFIFYVIPLKNARHWLSHGHSRMKLFGPPPPPPHPHSTHTQTHPQGVVIPYNEHSHLPGSLPDMLISDLQNIAVFILWVEWEAVLMFFSASTCLWTVGSSFLIVVLFRWKWQCVFFPCKTEALMKDEWFSCWHKRFPTCGMTLVQHGSFDFLLFCLEGSFNVT